MQTRRNDRFAVELRGEPAALDRAMRALDTHDDTLSRLKDGWISLSQLLADEAVSVDDWPGLPDLRDAMGAQIARTEGRVPG
jgi:hypothetical protein